MSRRDVSKREKLRLEEKAIDKQLQDAGFEVADMSMEDKKSILQMLEESRKFAQEEEDRRQQEDQILMETLNKSFSDKSNVKENKTTNSANKNNSCGLPLDIKDAEPIVEQINEEDEPSRSGSTTPDLFTSPAGASAKPGTSHEQIPAAKAASPEPIIEDQPSPLLEVPPQAHSIGPSENEMACPLCQRFFPLTKIEAHASDCLGPSDDTPVQQPASSGVRTKRRHNNQKNDDVLVINENSDDEVKYGKMPSRDIRSQRARTPVKHERCRICDKVIKEGDEYLNHVHECQFRFQASPSTSSVNSRTPGRGQTSFSTNDVSPSAIRSRPPIGKRPSIFEQLEGGSGIPVHLGDITDAAYRNPTTAIVHIVNCVAVRPHGLSETLADKYPYCNTYKERQPIDNLNRSCVADRGKPGSIKICRSHFNAQDPVVVDVHGQFYMGKAYHKNLMSKRLVSQMKNYKGIGEVSQANTGPRDMRQSASSEKDHKYFDPHLLRGLEADTAENRIKWFREALEHLEQSLAGEGIKTVVFPFGIGCGLAGGNWDRDYYPAIVNFKDSVAKQDVNVILVKKVEKTLSEQAQTAAGTQKTSRYRGTKM